MNIRILGLALPDSSGQILKKVNRSISRLVPRRMRKRAVRYSLLAANLVVLAAVGIFVINGSTPSSTNRTNLLLASSNTDSVVNPLDQLSSADIAVQVARLTNLYEVASVTNNADSLNSQLSASSPVDSVVTKPQIVSTASKSYKDIQTYVTQAGDSISSLAVKFGITSDTIRWSNDLPSGDTLAVGRTLVISPVSGIVYTVKAGDTADKLATKFRANKDQIISFNDGEKDPNGVVLGRRIVIPEGVQVPVYQNTYASGFAWGGIYAVYGFNGYDYGWCTWYVANRRTELGRPVPSNLGNAYSWYVLAQRAGLPTGNTPAVGAVAVNQPNNHVSVVEAINPDGSFWVSEMNSRGQVSMTDPTPTGGWGRRDYKIITSIGSLKFIY